MKRLHTKTIRQKCAELLLADDNIVIVRYNGHIISQSGGGTLKNIEGIYDLYLEFCVSVFLREEQRRKEREELCEEAGRMGWKNFS